MGMLEPVSGELREKILEDVGYTEAGLLEDMKRLRAWLEGQPHLPPSAKSEGDCFLESFLVGCKGDLSLAKEKMDSYYSARSRMPNVHGDRDPATFIATKESIKMCTLVRASPDGCRISIVSITDSDVEKLDFHMFMKRFLAIVELRMRSEGAFRGEWVVMDGRNITATHLHKLVSTYTSDIKDIMQFAQHILPSRIKGIIFINSPSFTEKFVNMLIKPFLKKKLADRIFIYSGDEKALLKHFPKEIVPKEFGGEGEEHSKISDLWLEEIESQKGWFTGTLSETTNEPKRLAQGCNMELVYGSFRKLDID